jgi:Flp pilus assembly protein TadG
MKSRSFLRATDGATALEFALTAPVFLGMVIGSLTIGVGLFTQIALQHGVEMAARCATINTSICGSSSSIQTYAVQQSLGLHPPSSTFTVSTPTCGNQVQASYPIKLNFAVYGRRDITLTASSCFPK